MTDKLSELLDAAIRVHTADIHTAIPGVIVSGNGTTVNVQPSLTRRLRDGRTERLPVVPNVPVWFPAGGGTSITWPVGAGDPCLLVFCERSLDEWKGAGSPSTPADPRRHALSDAVAFVGLNRSLPGSDDGIRLKMGDVTLEVSDEGVTVDTGGTTFGITDDGVTMEVGAVTFELTESGMAITGGTITHNGTNIGDDHVHSGVAVGGSNTGGPV